METLNTVARPLAPLPVGDDCDTVEGRWTFAGATALAFDHHVEKSVPLYHEGHELIDRLLDFFARDGGRVVEVGTSTGALIERLARDPARRTVTFTGIDVEADMVALAQQRCATLPNVAIELADGRTADYSGTDAVILYYTLQFIDPEQRQELLDRIHAELRPGGAVFLFEKVRCPDAKFQDVIQQAYWSFKSSNGFTADEILGKARSLRSVMHPASSAENAAMLERAGFSSVMSVQKYLCFEGLLAIK